MVKPWGSSRFCLLKQELQNCARLPCFVSTYTNYETS
jgi:hypothetical protein